MKTLLSARKPTVSQSQQNWQMELTGLVQGVGFRPFVCRLADSLGLSGVVFNTGNGVCIEVSGPFERLRNFRRRLKADAPPAAILETVLVQTRPAAARNNSASGFRILGSQPAPGIAKGRALIPFDRAPCEKCLAELFDPENRRFGHAFISCTDCGPRFSVLSQLPYDRENTSMRAFPMCVPCRQEYEDPADRRFHNQNNCCPQCGPRLSLTTPPQAASSPANRNDGHCIEQAARLLHSGRILALQGVGGFQLLVDASNENAIDLLRKRKRRLRKPFAVLFSDTDQVRQVCEVNANEAALLREPGAPIVLLKRRQNGELPLPSIVAPDNFLVGAMLPASPLHHLVSAAVGRPLIATSGNLSGEPIAIDPVEARSRLAQIADAFLEHDRSILRPLDDSVFRLAVGRPLPIRLGRGYTPVSLKQSRDCGRSILATGGHLKNTGAILARERLTVGPHTGDLDTALAFEQAERNARDLHRMLGPGKCVPTGDQHPDYASGRLVPGLKQEGLISGPPVGIQHHHAHVLAVLAEHEIEEPVLGIVWDGVGLGSDNTLWGGEFLIVEGAQFRRFAHQRPFRLPGGEMAIREGRRAAVGVLFEMLGTEWHAHVPEQLRRAFAPPELPVLVQMLSRQLNSPATSSVGRLFDALSALTGLCYRSDFEGEAAMRLEQACTLDENVDAYDFGIREPTPGAAARADIPLIFDWAPMVHGVLEDLKAHETVGTIARRFHETLVNMALLACERLGLESVVLSGGCFQNQVLLERLVTELKRRRFRVYWPRRLPPGDGGLAAGQALGAARLLATTALGENT